MLRSLTMSPMNAALQQAHQMARRHLETGGAAPPALKRAKADLPPRDFVLPLDVDAEEVRKAIEAKLCDRAPQPPLIERRAGGRVAVPA